MSDNVENVSENAAPAAPIAIAPEEISYHAVEKNGVITSIWEMRGRRHLRTIHPQSEEGRHLLGHASGSETAHNAQA